MNYKEFNIALPIKDNNVQIVDGIVQYDTANIVNVRLMDGVEPFDFTGYTEVILDILKPDGTFINACVTDNPEITDDNDPYRIQVVDPKEGRISFTLQGQATLLTGSHFAEITVMGAGASMTAAKINYHVGDTIARDTDPESLTSSDDYVTLRQLIAKNSAISTEERNRVDVETLRKMAELAREERFNEMEELVQQYIANAEGYVNQTEYNMELSKQYAELAKNPSKEIIKSLAQELDLVTKQYTDNLVAANTKDFNAGTFTDSDDERKLLKVRTGTASQKPALVEGEFGFCTDTKRLFIGDTPVNGVYVVGASAPTEKHVLWIDTSAGNSIKYWNGTTWQATATATFS